MNIKVDVLPSDKRMFPIIATIGKDEKYFTKITAEFLRDQLTEALEKLNG